MSTQSIALKSFAQDAQEGRMQQPLNILGAEMFAKLTSDDTDGTVAIFQQNLPPMSGPPLHHHSREDEWFYVLDGKISFQIDGQQIILRAGSSVFVPRGTTHTFQNFGPAAARMLLLVTPGHFQRFFEELTLLDRGLPAPDLELTLHDSGGPRSSKPNSFDLPVLVDAKLSNADAG